MTAAISPHRRGVAGEEAAAAFLARSGWTVLERNYRWKGGEIDIIAEKDEMVAFVEVKSWAVLPAQELEHSVDLRKQGRITRTARVYLSQKPGLAERRLRFDVIFIGPDASRIRHIENAFGGGID
jgi:putative endonuclease